MPPKKTVLITGCSAGGIGAALAVAFQKRGFHVFATARDPAKMPPEFAHLPDVTRLPLDVTSRASIDAAVAAVRKATGGTLDILVNNAGVPYVVPALDADVRVARDVFDANFFGVLETTKAFAPLLVAAAPGAIVVNICSTAAHITTPWMGVYAASKAAMEQYSEALRLELRPYGVRVLSVVAGAVATNMTASSPPLTLPEGSFFRVSEEETKRREAGESFIKGMPAEVFAEKVVSDALGGVTGRVYRGLGATFVWFLSSWCPRLVQDKLAVTMRGGAFERAL